MYPPKDDAWVLQHFSVGFEFYFGGFSFVAIVEVQPKRDTEEEQETYQR